MFFHSHTRSSRICAAILWLMQVPEEFFHMIEQRKPVALVLMAHQAILIPAVFLVLLHRRLLLNTSCPAPVIYEPKKSQEMKKFMCQIFGVALLDAFKSS